MINSALVINTNELELTDLVELNVLQKIQDAFATSFHIPLLIYNKEGKAITRASCFTDFCAFVRSSEKGLMKCKTFDSGLITEMQTAQAPIIKKGCAFESISTAAIPIRINDIHLANFIIGQVVEKELNEIDIINFANEIGVDSNSLLQKSKTLALATNVQLQKAIEFLDILTQQISLMGFQNLQNKILLQQQKEYEKKIAFEHSNFQAIFNNKYLAYTIIGKDYKIVDLNEVAKLNTINVFGIEPFKGQSIYDFMVSLGEEEFKISFEKAFAGEFVFIEKDFISPEDKQMWFLHELVPIADYKNEIKSICLISLDITNWKNAEILSKTNQKLYQLLAENSNDVVWLLDMDFQFIYLSPSTERLFGYKLSERQDLLLTDVYKPEMIHRLKILFKQKQIEYYENGTNEVEIVEIEGIHKLGFTVFFEVSAKFVLDDLGVIVGVQGSSHDITDRKFLEIAHNLILDLYSKSDTYESEHILNLCLEKSIEITQSELGFIHFKDKQHGNSLQIGKTTTALLENKPLFCEDCFTYNMPFNYDSNLEFIQKKQLSSELQFFDRLLTIPIKQGEEVVGVLGLINKKCNYKQFDIDLLINITTNLWNIIRRKNAEVLARKLQKAVESAKTCIVITNLRGEIEYANPYFTETTGYQREEYLGKKTSVLKSGKHDRSYYQNLWQTIKAGQTWEGEFCNKNKSGNLYWENVVISPITNYKNEITHFVAVKSNISEYKKITTELIAAKERAEESDRLKSAFLRNISHEVRTPMNAIVGFSGLMLRPEISKDKKIEFTNIINKSVNKLLSVIENMIILAHIETNQLKINKIDFNPNHLIWQLFDDYKLLNCKVLEQNIQFKVTSVIETNPNFASDYTLLQQILRIFLDNAFKFTKQGEIQFGCRLNNNKVEFFIKDSGIGIPKEKKHLIFRRFAHADENVTQHFGGMGVGVSIASGLIKLLGGEMIINSEEKIGTEVIFSLALSEQPMAKATSNNITTETTNEKVLNILVAEDEEFNYLYIKEIFEPFEFNLFHAINGEEAIELFKTHQIDLVLMDLKMPVVDGYQAAYEIRRMNKTVPIIAQTAFSHKREDCLSSDFTDYISKPFSKQQFISILHKYVEM